MRNVLILTRSPDPHVPPVAEAIRARGLGVVCFNLADFPEEVALQATLDGRQDGWSGSISYQEQHVALDSLASIWWRRPKQYKAPATYSPGERTFLEEEANRGIIGVLESLALQQTLWVSRLHSIRRAELKPLQLAAAQQLGLRTPRTLLTNDPGAACAFYEACQGQVVLKAVSRGAIEEEERRFIYTSRVLPEHLASLEGVRATTHLFQEYLPKRLDVRVVVIGRQVFAAEIHSQQSERTRLDFRQGYEDLTYAIHTLPGGRCSQGAGACPSVSTAILLDGLPPDAGRRLCVSRSEPQWTVLLVADPSPRSLPGQGGDGRFTHLS